MKNKSFDTVLDDIDRLKGRPLKSIRPGADITVIAVDRTNQRVEVLTQDNQEKSRSFDELRRIWEVLQARPAVHVDAVLSGSGSSRNQPETILAHLPYIEWLYIDRKKHLTLTGSDTHSIGTAKRMDPMRAQEVATKIRSASPLPAALLLTSELANVIAALKNEGIEVRAIQPNAYRLTGEHLNIWVADASIVKPLAPGGYIIIPSGSFSAQDPTFSLGGALFCKKSIDYVLAACEE